MHAGFQVDLKLHVKHAAAVGVRLVLGTADNDGDRCIRHSDRGEGTPASHGVGGVLGSLHDLQESLKVDRVVEGSGDDTNPARVPLGCNSSVPLAGNKNRLAAGGDSALLTPAVQAVGHAVTDINRLVSGVID